MPTDTTATPRPPGPVPGALASQLRRHRQNWARMLLILAGLSLGIALFLTALEGRGFWPKLIYAACIGLCCALIVDAVRLAACWLSDRLQVARGLPLEDAARSNGWRGVLPGSLLAVFLGPSSGMWLADQITGLRSPSLLDFGPGARVTLVLTALATVVTVVIVSTMERLAHMRMQAEAAQRQAAENQLRLLQSQLEPHMLFNTLANLRVLIGLDPARAQTMLDHLIGFLRSTLAATRQPQHTLRDEFAHLQDYLALMAIRMGARLSTRLNLPDDLADRPVPPLLLQPLVENAIKHGLEPQVAGGRIEISATRAGPQLRLEVRDTGAGLGAAAVAAGTSFGLEQVRTRLATLFGNRASLNLDPAGDAEGGVRAVLHLPLDPTPP